MALFISILCIIVVSYIGYSQFKKRITRSYAFSKKENWTAILAVLSIIISCGSLLLSSKQYEETNQLENMNRLRTHQKIILNELDSLQKEHDIIVTNKVQLYRKIFPQNNIVTITLTPTGAYWDSISKVANDLLTQLKKVEILNHQLSNDNLLHELIDHFKRIKSIANKFTTMLGITTKNKSPQMDLIERPNKSNYDYINKPLLVYQKILALCGHLNTQVKLYEDNGWLSFIPEARMRENTPPFLSLLSIAKTKDELTTALFRLNQVSKNDYSNRTKSVSLEVKKLLLSGTLTQPEDSLLEDWHNRLELVQETMSPLDKERIEKIKETFTSLSPKSS